MVGLAMVALVLSGCTEDRGEETLAAQGRFLLSMLRFNEMEHAEGRAWVDPASCRDSTAYVIQMSHRQGIVATELPAWACDWTVLAGSSTNAAAPVLVTRMGEPRLCHDFGRGDVVVVRRDGEARKMAVADLRNDLLRFGGTTNIVAVGGGRF